MTGEPNNSNRNGSTQLLERQKGSSERNHSNRNGSTQLLERQKGSPESVLVSKRL